MHVCPLQYSSHTIPATQFKSGLLADKLSEVQMSYFYLWYQKSLKLWNRHQFGFEEKNATIFYICIKCLVNTQHVVKITGVTSGAGIKNPYGAYECIHGFNRDCAVPFVVSCVVFRRSLFVLFLKTYSEDKIY